MTKKRYSFYDEKALQRAPRGLPLLLAMQGYSDVGSTVSQLEDYFENHYETELLCVFDADDFLAYRARRPVLTFEIDHFTEYSPDQLSLQLSYDELGAPFLVLSGYEPDFKWNAFMREVEKLCELLEVSHTVWVQGLPMPVPHSRPILTIVSGSRQDLIEERSSWRPVSRISGSIAHALEYKLQTAGKSVSGFSLLLPHYLSDNAYPLALVAALENIMAATGLILAIDEVREEAREYNQKIDTQVQMDEDAQNTIGELTKNYDERAEETTDINGFDVEKDGAAYADRLVSELEDFLAKRKKTSELLAEDFKGTASKNRFRNKQTEADKSENTEEETP